MKTTQEYLLEFLFEVGNKTDPAKTGRKMSQAESLMIMNKTVDKYAKLIDEDKEITLKLDDDKGD